MGYGKISTPKRFFWENREGFENKYLKLRFLMLIFVKTLPVHQAKVKKIFSTFGENKDFMWEFSTPQWLSCVTSEAWTGREWQTHIQAGYQQSALNCWTAALLYLVTLSVSAHQVWANTQNQQQFKVPSSVLSFLLIFMIQSTESCFYYKALFVLEFS